MDDRVHWKSISALETEDGEGGDILPRLHGLCALQEIYSISNLLTILLLIML